MIASKRILIVLALSLTVVGIFAGLKMIEQSGGQASSTNVVIAEPVIPKTLVPNMPPRQPVIPAPIIVPKEVAAIIPLVVPYRDGITAKAYLVGDVSTSKVYLDNNSSTVLPVASVSKLLTVLVASTVLVPTDRITITKEEVGDLPPDDSNIGVGETFTVAEILYPLLLNSSNIAAEALASSSNRINFLESMSSYAWKIGMPDTYFADSSGVNIHNQATAKDIFTLAKYLYKSRPDILAITRTASTSVATTTDHESHVFVSTHPFVNDPRFLGGKTGRTLAAGETMLTILKIKNKPIALIVLGSLIGSRENDTKLLIDKVSGLI